MAERQSDPFRLQLKNVRASYLHIYQPKAFGDDPNATPKFSGNFIMDPSTSIGKTNIAKIEDAIDRAIDEKWPKNPPKLKMEKLCLRDGDDDDENYEGMVYLSASNDARPLVLDADKQDVREGDDGAPYSGCYVDVIVRIWAMDNKWGKRVNASLEAVKFRADGEAFGARRATADDFDDDDDGDTGGRRRSSGRGRGDDDDDRGSRRRGRDDDGDDRGSRNRRGSDDDQDARGSGRRGRDRDADDGDGDDRGSRGRSRGRQDDDEGGSSRRRGSNSRDDDEGTSDRRRGRSDDDGDRGSRRGRDDDDDDRGSRNRRGRDDDDDARGGGGRRGGRDDDDEDRPSRNRRDRRGRGADDDVI